MDRQTVKDSLTAFGITQTELARAAGLSEAAISRQLSGSLPITDRVTNAAKELLVQRGVQVVGRLLDWIEPRRFGSARGKKAESDGTA